MISFGYSRLSWRFWDKVAVMPDGCWDWTAYRNRDGYGQFAGEGNSLAHRVSYAGLVAPIPNGLQIDHLCRNRSCVNPSHLEVVTLQENTRRGLKEELKTHCPQGHPYEGDNLYLHSKTGWRQCHTCRREVKAKRLARSE